MVNYHAPRGRGFCLQRRLPAFRWIYTISGSVLAFRRPNDKQAYSFVQDVDRRVDIPIMGGPARWTRPCTNRQRQFTDDVPAARARLARREKPIDCDDLLSVS